MKSVFRGDRCKIFRKITSSEKLNDNDLKCLLYLKKEDNKRFKNYGIAADKKLNHNTSVLKNAVFKPNYHNLAGKILLNAEIKLIKWYMIIGSVPLSCMYVFGCNEKILLGLLLVSASQVRKIDNKLFGIVDYCASKDYFETLREREHNAIFNAAEISNINNLKK